MRHSQQITVQLQEAITLAQSGQRTEARRLLLEVVSADPQREIAWMWLATLATSRPERLKYLERALNLNPHNPRAQEAYARLAGHDFVPAEQPPPSKRAAGWLAALQQEPSMSLGAFFALMVLGAAALVIVLIAINQRETSTPETQPTLAPVFVLPTNTAGPSPTPTRTPPPTWTPGPSPTSLWDAPLPTWTPSYTHTPQPTRTPWPSSTPSSTITASPTATQTASATYTAAASPSPSSTPSQPSTSPTASPTVLP